MDESTLRVHLPLSYNAKGAKCLIVRGPFKGELELGHYPIEYSIGVFITNSYPTMEDAPDIEIRIRLNDVIALKNALSAIQLIAEK